jgi:V/A-type H+-transporting ATPase subunit A
LDTARSIREDYLQQSAYDEVDTYTSIKKQFLMLSTILEFGRMESDAIKRGVLSSKIGELDSRKLISKIKWTKEEEVEKLVNEIKINMAKEFEKLLTEVNS